MQLDLVVAIVYLISCQAVRLKEKLTSAQKRYFLTYIDVKTHTNKLQRRHSSLQYVLYNGEAVLAIL